MIIAVVAFFVVLVYFQKKAFYDRQLWRELTVFLGLTALAAYYALGQLGSIAVVNPSGMINRLVTPMVVSIFG